MSEHCILYYITDRSAFPGDERARRISLLDKITEAAAQNIDYIQLREKDLSTRDLELLAREAMHIIKKLRTENPDLRTALLINSRTDVALATGAAGVHLPAGDLSPEDVRKAWRGCASSSALSLSLQNPLVAVSCHSPQEVEAAAAKHATFAVFAPVFEKQNAPNTAAQGLDALRQACRANIPVLALGGVNLQNTESCLRAGAAGIAAIRLFQENEITTIVNALRGRN